MKLTLADPKYFKESITIISELVTDARFIVNANGVELVAMDPANVAMVIFKLFSSAFTEYEVKAESKMGINLASLKQVLRRIKSNDILTLEMEGDNKIKITLKSNVTRTFSLPIIEFDEQEQKKEPELSFPVTVQLNAGVFSDAIEDADIVSDAVMFIVDGDKLKVQAEGDLSKATIEIKADKDTKIVSDSSDKVKAKYSLEYLKKMVGGGKLSDELTMKFNTDYPLKLEYKSVDKVMMSFILAPRVEND